MPRVRVLEVITGGEAGGAQRHLADLVRGLARQGDEVLVVHGGGTWIDTVIPVPTAYVADIRRAPDPVHDLRALARLISLVDSFQPDIIHGHSSKGGFLARLAGQRRRLPVVFTAHGFVVLDPTRSRGSRRVFRWVEAWAARRSAAVIGVSERDRELAAAMGAPHAVCIPNAVEVPREPWEPPRSETFTVGFLARFSREKGFEVLVSALQDFDGPVTLKVAGDGPLAGDYRDVAARAAVRCEFVGWQDDPSAFLRTLNVLAVPSWKEGLPYVLLDALALGIPTVVTDVGGMGDVMRRLDPRLVVPPGRPPELRAGIEAARGLGPAFVDRARALIREHFSLDEMVRRTREVLWEASRA
jgi:glycosyltransferase involved in cell wall biosynthesis